MLRYYLLITRPCFTRKATPPLAPADGLMTLIDDVNLNGISPLVREAFGLEAEGADGRS